MVLPFVAAMYSSIADCGTHQSPCTKYEPGKLPPLHKRATLRFVSGLAPLGKRFAFAITSAASEVLYNLGSIGGVRGKSLLRIN